VEPPSTWRAWRRSRRDAVEGTLVAGPRSHCGGGLVWIALSQPPGRTQALAYVMGFIVVAGVMGGRTLAYLYLRRPPVQGEEVVKQPAR
jgi:hypothetical protein